MAKSCEIADTITALVKKIKLFAFTTCFSFHDLKVVYINL